MFKNTILIIFSLLLCTRTVFSQWDFAVATKGRIIFYDETFTELKSAAHHFVNISAIAFDEVKERVFFNGYEHTNGSIFSLKLPLGKGNPQIIENIVTKTPNESISGLAYDPLEENLYWTDNRNKKIYSYSVNAPPDSEPKILFDFSKSNSIPHGIAIDVCRRKLYWTNSNSSEASIHVSSLNGEDEKTIINTGLHLPYGIVVDQLTDRIYYVVDQIGTFYTIESAKLDGSDRQIVLKRSNKVPISLTVFKDAIYWTDVVHQAVWTVPKYNPKNVDPQKVKSINDIGGIVSRVGLISKLKADGDCKEVIKKFEKNLFPLDNYTTKKFEENHEQNCLGNGYYSKVSDACTCKAGYSGARCETYECHNYCVHGTCQIVNGFAKCSCQIGFEGERCQASKCSNYCMNDGQCSIVDEEPVCECASEFIGRQCSVNATAECVPYCLLMQKDIDVNVPRHCYRICKNLHPEDLVIQNLKRPDEVCRGTWNKSIIVLVCGGLGGLVLIYVIIQTLRRIYKPVRPRIKKTFVVQKKVSQTPLTCRPIATEQCEITIENCCNMNICDTPCFDTKLLQQNMSTKSNKKEDKEILINNMEDDLY
ncbi:protein cueball [Eupeodes corollae]|uniref:protein cueball n=1 Tax=Eupeodes corollae TaxID=290404 RepID=UPI00249394A7|nr:protein cueball [Eupeodes corollae]